MRSEASLLQPRQVCFIVDSVAEAVAFCETKLNWGPFYQFTAPIDDAVYRDWRGKKVTDVALGMAGAVQVEFLHVHQGHDTTEDYQSRYGSGFQHLGIHCRSREEALQHLESLGASTNEINEYPGIRFAFVNVVTGDGMFEILQPTEEMANQDGLSGKSHAPKPDTTPLFDIDRATLVTDKLDDAVRFYASAFNWQSVDIVSSHLQIGEQTTEFRRCMGKAGLLEIELLEPVKPSEDPYSQHLKRGPHGLVHAGGWLDGPPPEQPTLSAHWLDTQEHFSLYDWLGSEHSVQVRHRQTL